MLIAVVVKMDFKLALLDILAAFLKAKTLNLEVYVLFPKDIRTGAVLWSFLEPSID